jgi:predicted dehydrogenase
MQKYQPIGTAIIGCGIVSKLYIESIKKRFGIIDLKACFDLDSSRMNACADQYGLKAMTLEEIFADPSIELVVNLTNPAAHHSISKRAMLAGKNVFSEKPIAITLAEANDLVDVAHVTGVRLGVAPDTFLGAGIQTAKYIIDKGLIGKPLSFVISLSRDFGIYGELLPHLDQIGGGIGLDMGGYYLTALASILGPVEKILAMTKCHEPNRTNMNLTSKNFGDTYTIITPNIVTAVVCFRGGVIGSLHMNADSIVDETRHLEIYGTEGILYIDDPNIFGSKITLKKVLGATIDFPFTHGYSDNLRGLGLAEMAWSIRAQRKHRVSMELAYHVFEIINGIMISSETGLPYTLKSMFEIPVSLPEGYIDNGFWGPTEESALV